MADDIVQVEIDQENGETAVIDISDDRHLDAVNLQMVLVTSSMNHEYARKAYEKTQSFQKKQELLARMAELKNLYYVARAKFSKFNPEKLDVIEKELSFQKQSVFSEASLN